MVDNNQRTWRDRETTCEFQTQRRKQRPTADVRDDRPHHLQNLTVDDVGSAHVVRKASITLPWRRRSTLPSSRWSIFEDCLDGRGGV